MQVVVLCLLFTALLACAAALELNALPGGIIFSSNRNSATGKYSLMTVVFEASTTSATAVVPEQLTFGDFNDMNPKVNPAGTKAVFYSDRSGNQDIWEIDLITKALRQLTTGSSSEYDPIYSPDGNYILYKSNYNDGYGDIWRMNADGTAQRNLTPNRGSTEDWAPAVELGTSQIFFTSRPANTGPSEDKIWSMNWDGSNQQLVTNSVEGSPNWYPVASTVTDGLTQFLYIFNSHVGAQDEVWSWTRPGISKMVDRYRVLENAADPTFSKGNHYIGFIKLVPSKQGGQYYRLYVSAQDGMGQTAVEPSTHDTTHQVLGPWWYPPLLAERKRK